MKHNSCVSHFSASFFECFSGVTFAVILKRPAILSDYSLDSLGIRIPLPATVVSLKGTALNNHCTRVCCYTHHFPPTVDHRPL